MKTITVTPDGLKIITGGNANTKGLSVSLTIGEDTNLDNYSDVECLELDVLWGKIVDCIINNKDVLQHVE